MVQENSNYKKRNWYNSQKFPLLPVLNIKKADEHNTSGFTFEWLFLKIWTLDSFDFEIATVISNHWGIGVTAIVPYLRVICCIPFPEVSNTWIQRTLWRKPADQLNKL